VKSGPASGGPPLWQNPDVSKGKPVNRSRPQVIYVYCTEADKRTIEQAAAKVKLPAGARMPVNAWVLAAALAEARRQGSLRRGARVQ
jgi:hypothetical protein